MSKALGQIVFETLRKAYGGSSNSNRVWSWSYQLSDDQRCQASNVAVGDPASAAPLQSDCSAERLEIALCNFCNLAEDCGISDDLADSFEELCNAYDGVYASGLFGKRRGRQIEERSDEVEPKHHSASLTQKAAE